MKLLMVRQILLVSTSVKVQRTVWRIWKLMLGCKVLDSCDALFWCLQEVFPLQLPIDNFNMCTCLAVQLWGKKSDIEHALTSNIWEPVLPVSSQCFFFPLRINEALEGWVKRYENQQILKQKKQKRQQTKVRP